MKTIVIFDGCEADIKFFIHDGKDISYLDRVYVNDISAENLHDELNEIMFNEDGTYKVKLLDNFPVKEFLEDEKVIICGWFP